MTWALDGQHIEGMFRGICELYSVLLESDCAGLLTQMDASVPGMFFPWLFFRFYVSPGPAVFQMTHYSAFFWNMLYILYLVATYRFVRPSPKPIMQSQLKLIL